MADERPEEVEDVEQEENVEEEPEEDVSLSNPEVVLKYKTAGRFVNQVLQELIGKCVHDAKVLDICEEGDKKISELTKGIYTKKNPVTGKPIPRGVAIPTCVSVNNIVCYYSPLSDDTLILRDGDVVRVELGVHIDGFLASAATTIIVGGPEKLEESLRTKAADVLAAAAAVQEAAVRALRPGNRNHDVTDIITKICEDYGVQACEGVLSHQIRRHEIDGKETILQKRVLSDNPQKVEEVEFDVGQAWNLDIVLSTGTGKLRPGEARTFLYKRAPNTFKLRLRVAREILSTISSQFMSFPFALRALDEKRGRIGVSECLKHHLLAPWPVLYEKGGEVVAHLKSTVLILNSGIERVAFVPIPSPPTSAKTIQNKEVKELMNRGLSFAAKKKNKSKSKKKEGAAAEEEAGEKKE